MLFAGRCTRLGEMAGRIALGVTAARHLVTELDKIPFIQQRFFNPDGSYKSAVDQWIDRNLPWLAALDPTGPSLPQGRRRRLWVGRRGQAGVAVRPGGPP
jgi:hypothetical protein